MEKRLGISLYPHKSSVEDNKKYIDQACALDYKRVFSCMLTLADNRNSFDDFKTTMLYAASKGLDVFFDVSPSVLTEMNVSHNDLSFFKDIGAKGLRLDVGYGGIEESLMSFNKEGLDLELNMSNNNPYLELINSYAPNTSKLQGCHNFYPQKYTGLNFSHFEACSQRFKKHGLRTAAFVTSQKATHGHVLINDGLCTLEKHRTLPITTQAKELWATKLIDDVIIGNAFASLEELEALSKINPDVLEFSVDWLPSASEKEKLIASESIHFRRGDINDYFIRATQSRVKHKNADIPEKAYDGPQQIGDIYIGNNSFGHYKGEIQICITEVPNDNRKNLIGRIKPHEIQLLSYINEWAKFRLI